MSDTFCFGRTNFFRVEKPKQFLRWVRKRHLGVLHSEENRDLFTLLPHPKFGEFQSIRAGLKAGRKFEPELAAHLAQGAVAVVYEIGCDESNHVFGFATAINSEGRTVTIALEEIFGRAEKLFGALNSSWTDD
jgi:hypothetical protein